MSNSRDRDPFDGITESDLEDAAPDSLIIDASDTEVIDVEKINSCIFVLMKTYFKSNWASNNLSLSFVTVTVSVMVSDFNIY